MKRFLLMLCFATLSVTQADDDFRQRYAIISNRNIFAANRTVQSVQPPPTVKVPEPPPLQKDAITLLGVAVLGDKATALFVGNVPDFAGNYRPGDQIDVLQVKTVATTGVTLMHDETELRLSVGTTLTRLHGGPWQISTNPADTVKHAAALPAGSEASESSAPAAASSGPNASSGDILKRLREQRQRELHNEAP